MRTFFFILIVHFTIFCQGQNRCDGGYIFRSGKLKVTNNMRIIPYQDNSSFWGLKNKLNDSIIIPAKFSKIYENFNDTAFILSSKDREIGAINLREEILAPFYNGDYCFNDFDTAVNYGGILAAPVCVNGAFFLRNTFFVDRKGDCIPYEYYPCPYGVKVSDGNLSMSLFYIQKAEENRLSDMRKSIEFCNKAIESDTLNPASYYWGVRIFMANNELNIASSKDKKYEEYYSWVEFCIEKGIKYEKNPHYLIKLNRYKKAFYTYCKTDKTRAEEAKIAIQNYKETIKHENDSSFW
jgi:hypothetical protein